jgi:hypothetical protein
MKYKHFFACIAVIILVIFAACPDGGGGGSSRPAPPPRGPREPRPQDPPIPQPPSDAPIPAVNVRITRPENGDTLVSSADVTVPASGVNTGNVQWVRLEDKEILSAGYKFGPSQSYRVTITLTASSPNIFTDSTKFTINNSDDLSIDTTRTDTSVTISADFTTRSTMLESISITNEPEKTTYTHGDLLDLRGIVVTKHFNDSTSEPFTYDKLSANNILTTIDGNEVVHDASLILRHLHHDLPVRITVDGRVDIPAAYTTGELIVNPKGLTIATATHTRQYDGTTPTNGTTNVSGVILTFNGLVGSETVTPDTVIANYASINAGERTLNITSVTLLPETYSGNYTVTPRNITMAEGGITKATGAAVTPGTLTVSDFTADSITVSGATLVGSTGQTIEYARSAPGGATPNTAWQSGTTFSGLSPGTTYYIFARSAESQNFFAGATASVQATTKIAPTIGITFTPATGFVFSNPIVLNRNTPDATVTVELNAAFDAGSVVWKVNDAPRDDGTDTSLTLRASQLVHNVGNDLHVEGKIDGVLYGAMVPITVLN